MKKKSFDDELGHDLVKRLNIKADIVPLIDQSDEEILLGEGVENVIRPILPVMDQVLMPGVMMPVAASRRKSRQLLHEVKGTELKIAVFTQQNDNPDPTDKDLVTDGVVARVIKAFDVNDDVTVAILQGIVKCNHLKVHETKPYMFGFVDINPELDMGFNTPQFVRRVKRLRKEYSQMMRSRVQDDEIVSMLTGIGSDKIFVNYACSHMDVPTETKYQFLACDTYQERVERMLKSLKALRGIDELRREIDDKTQDSIGRQQREYYLRHQLDIIQEELANNGGDGSEANGNADVQELKKKAKEVWLTDEVQAVFDKELTKLGRMSPMSPDYTVQYNYLDTLLDFPWRTVETEPYSLEHARDILEEDHYGIEKVKEQVIEYMAVNLRRKANNIKQRAQVLCLVGPPGTGKTSICRSIAKAMDVPYQRVALGGLHDEAEIRGHRRTYVGAMPGRIVQELIKAKVTNPVFVLDEIDKVQRNSYNGDPSSALLEVLDPEQNSHFHDNYMGMDIDLSNVTFIATANSLSEVHPALIDRMEIIDFSGYVLEEKQNIASRHLVPRILKENGLSKTAVRFSDEILTQIINEYTREGGVRQLEKQISKLVRHRVLSLYLHKRQRSAVSPAELREVLGLPIHNSEHRRREAREGVVTGLAWTPVGGEILFIESSLSRGKGTLSLTGNLGDVMKESATLAFEYLKTNHDTFGIDYKLIEESNVHIHVPEGATPKDGPSAGITMFVAMVSCFTKKKVRAEVAMTGEITLRGEVTPVGGIKEKILAAKRAGITDLILCEENRRDVEDIKTDYLQGLTFHYINEMHEALPLALAVDEPKPASRKRNNKAE